MDEALSEVEKMNISYNLGLTLTGFAVGGIVGIVATIIPQLLSTNIRKQELTGNEMLAPTNDETVLSDKKTSASEIDSSLASDEVSASEGSLAASDLDAAASNVETTASESGATAVRTKAGASDIEVKALKMT